MTIGTSCKISAIATLALLVSACGSSGTASVTSPAPLRTAATTESNPPQGESISIFFIVEK